MIGLVRIDASIQKRGARRDSVVSIIVRCLVCIVLVAALAFMARPAASDAMTCVLDRPVMFAELDWDSNRLHTALAR